LSTHIDQALRLRIGFFLRSAASPLQMMTKPLLAHGPMQQSPAQLFATNFWPSGLLPGHPLEGEVNFKPRCAQI